MRTEKRCAISPASGLVLALALLTSGSVRQIEKRATVEGTVTTMETGRAVEGARIVLATPQGVAIAEARSDERGHFTIGDIGPGSFEISASRTGYLPSYWGETAGNGLRRRLAIEPAKPVPSISLVLWRGGAISGRVLDTSATPIARISVRALEVVFTAGSERLVPASASGRTDERGEFKLYGLPPGDYYVLASGAPFSSGVEAEGGPSGYAMAFVPGSPTVDGAARLSVTAGFEVNSGDLYLSRVSGLRISGRLVDTTGRLLGDEIVRLFPGGSVEVGLAAEVRTDKTGAFVFRGLPAGTYVLQMALRDSAVRLFAAQVVTLAGDTDDVTVELVARTGQSTVGTIRIEGDRQVDLSAASLDVTPLPTDFSRSPVAGGARGGVTNGTFRLSDVWGPHRLSISGLPSGVAVKGVYVGDDDYTDRPIDFAAVADRPVRVVLTTRVSVVAGRVTDVDGDPVPGCDVVLFPQHRHEWDILSRSIRRATTGTDGGFRFNAVRPQNYYIVAVTDLPLTRWQYRDVLDALRARATSVRVSEGESHELRLAARSLGTGLR